MPCRGPAQRTDAAECGASRSVALSAPSCACGTGGGTESAACAAVRRQSCRPSCCLGAPEEASRRCPKLSSATAGARGVACA
jgi:hypothetical protein